MELNSIPKTGTYADGVDRHNDNYAKINLELQTLRERGENEKGYFETILSLQSKFPTPQDGWQAYVADSASSTGYFVANVVNGAWVKTTAEAPAVGVNLAEYAKNEELENLATETTAKIENLIENTDSKIAQLAGNTVGIDNLFMINPERWEAGTISGTTGLNANSTTRIRTIDKHEIRPNADYNVSLYSEHKIALHLYEDDGKHTYVGEEFITKFKTFNTGFAKNYRIVVSKLDNSEISEHDILSVKVKLSEGLLPTSYTESKEDVKIRIDNVQPRIIKNIYTENVTIRHTDGGTTVNPARLATGYIKDVRGVANVPPECEFVIRYYDADLIFIKGKEGWEPFNSVVAEDYPYARIVFRFRDGRVFDKESTNYILAAVNIYAVDEVLGGNIIPFSGFGKNAEEAGAISDGDVYYNTNDALLQFRQIVGTTARRLPDPVDFFYRSREKSLYQKIDGKLYKLKYTEDKNLYQSGMINLSGNNASSVSQERTDYILLNRNKIYCSLIARNNTNVVSFYDTEKKYIDGIPGKTILSDNVSMSEYAVEAITPPENAVYARFCKYTFTYLRSMGVPDVNYVFQENNDILDDEIKNSKQKLNTQEGGIWEYQGDIAIDGDISTPVIIENMGLDNNGGELPATAKNIAYISAPLNREIYVHYHFGYINTFYSTYPAGALYDPAGAFLYNIYFFGKGVFQLKRGYKVKLSYIKQGATVASPGSVLYSTKTKQKDINAETMDDVPDNIGVYNAIRKAKQMAEIKFTPKNPIDYNSGTYSKGTTYTGLIYSSVKEISTYIGRNVSFHTFMTAINNPRSLLYTEKLNQSPYFGVNAKAYYGVVCSVFVAYAWGIDVDYRTYDFILADFTEEVQDQSAYGLKLGDGVWNPGHIVLVTNITRTKRGVITKIELAEAAQAGVRKFYMNSAEAFDEWMKTGGGRVIYRNKNLYANRNYEPLTDFVAVEDEAPSVFIYNDLICCNKGDKANYRVGENVILNIAEGYLNLEIYKDDILYNTIPLENEIDIELPDLPVGLYKARIIKDGVVSEFANWMVVDTSMFLDKVNGRVYFSSINATPFYFEFCNISGFRSEDYSKIDTHIFTAEELAQGYIEVEPPSIIPDNAGRTYTYAKVHFKTEYGIIINTPKNWYE